MLDEITPANISHTVIVHAGSYKDFIHTLTEKYPTVYVLFVKKVAIHYYILQLEDRGDKAVSKKELYSLPVMALREEFSNYIFFKNVKSYNNVLKRMCNASENKDAAYELFQHMLTPFEKGKIIRLQDAKKIKYTLNDTTSSIFSQESIKSMKTLANLFELDTIELDDVERNFTQIIKKNKWKVGIY
jgi:hypothetical protein